MSWLNHPEVFAVESHDSAWARSAKATTLAATMPEGEIAVEKLTPLSAGAGKARWPCVDKQFETSLSIFRSVVSNGYSRRRAVLSNDLLRISSERSAKSESPLSNEPVNAATTLPKIIFGKV
jgi:hypothetical protein